MRAIFVREFGGPERLRVEDVPDPKPGPSEVLVRIRAAGVNPVDVYIAAGTYPRKPALPYIPGSDGAGEVEAVGAEVQGLRSGRSRLHRRPRQQAGRRRHVRGTRVCTPAQLHRLPARATFAQGAALGVPYTTAYRALFHRAAARPGETVLVHGATGGVGIAAVQLAHAQGLRVIGTGGTERGLESRPRAGRRRRGEPSRAGLPRRDQGRRPADAASTW